MSDAQRAEHLDSLGPGSSLDYRGTTFTPELLEELLASVTGSGPREITRASFTKAVFTDYADFSGVTFTGVADFTAAEFPEGARFTGATFGSAHFEGAVFGSDVQFDGGVSFTSVSFGGARFGGGAFFDSADFGSTKELFPNVTFAYGAHFTKVEFKSRTHMGPLVCVRGVDLTHSVFRESATIEAAADHLELRHTQWDSTAALRLRYATVDLSNARFEYPITITFHSEPFSITHQGGRLNLDLRAAAVDLPTPGDDLPEDPLHGHDRAVQVTSLRGVDAAHLTLTNIDLTKCVFSGTIHLDQLRMEGRCPMAPAPSGISWRRGLPVRWTRRHTLAEEHHWRRSQHTAGEWVQASDDVQVIHPPETAALYRQLRKSFEDGKNEPDAADFYYGEMEMRRKDTGRPKGERVLLTGYWAVSGYGLRVSRALGWLLLAVVLTVALMMLWGVPQDVPQQETTGKLTGREITLTTDTPGPTDPDGKFLERISAERFEKALGIVTSAVVFRVPRQELTTSGTYIDMSFRVVAPVLLGLGALAVRGRVKR
ncbi:pentapeptide repeat-containing protein [Streptomyces sp. NPDC058665]|uniref:pentapeptide repeat-containing protein n=1 Tax=Streptomyces sp. NPDC058665 TaxID=3346586 RepID=UPI003663D153